MVGAESATGTGSSYYAVSSEDDDGDESAQSLGISPAAQVSSSGSGGGGGCFIDTLSQSMSKQGLWFVVLLGIGMAVSWRRTAIRF
jgi:hypothetical protein